ncbi:LysR substrate-binding domain-containing protein [Terasakiella sp. SH-1]|uniref:LysR substrate-binding domain-containing protein n=1 Tax=Terasakiella sp. SH-1 TaxID=2560057 RepID=UPI001F1154E8|nr:LysR substrate-binding domain-containing protein [Terasakiella sp. SH-1]
MPSFASLWLVPHLQQFTDQHPDIDIRIAAYDTLADFDRDDVDCAIRYGRGSWGNLHVEHIMDDEMFPVCAPHYLERHPSIITPEGLKHHTLLHDYAVLSEAETWEYWLKHAKIEGVDHTRGPKFSHTHMAMQACLSGEGIALGHSSMISSELQAGRLLRLFNISVPTGIQVCFVCPPESVERFKIRAFRDWLLSEIEEV